MKERPEPLTDVRALRVLGYMLYDQPHYFFRDPFKYNATVSSQPDPQIVARLSKHPYGNLRLSPNCGAGTVKKIEDWLEQFGMVMTSEPFRWGDKSSGLAIP